MWVPMKHTHIPAILVLIHHRLLSYICLCFKTTSMHPIPYSQTLKRAPLKALSKKRLATVTKQSKTRKDNLHSKFKLMTSPQQKKLKFHNVCISSYSSKLHVKRTLRKSKSDGLVPKRGRRSASTQFVWKE